ncbi:MAG: M28 family peptidase [Anaerolineae bacterium]|nr:M28 family peptidase [Anaerolineae bacterium]
MNLAQLDRQIIGEVWASDAVERMMSYACDYCNGRFACSEDEQRAGDYFLSQMESFGLQNVHAEPFTMLGWHRGEASLVVAFNNRQEKLDAWEMACSPAGVAAAELFDIGDGTKEGIEALGSAIAGKVILTNTQGPHRSIKYALCQQAGAVGLVIYNGTPGSMKPAGSVSLGEMPLKMPAVGVSYETGMYLLRQLKAGLTLTAQVSTTSTNEKMTARDIVGEIPGTDPDAGWIIVGGHYDGHDIAQGAYDNASGSILALECARVLAPLAGQLKTGLRFVLFSGEELGLYGSFHYADAHPELLDSIRAVFNADIVGMAAPLVLMTQEAPEYAAFLKSLPGDEIGITVNDKTYVPHSDHFPFALKGLSTLMAVTSRPDIPTAWIHTTADTLDKVKFNELKQACVSAARVLLRMAIDDGTQLPMVRKGQEAVMKDIRDHGYEETLKLQGIL